MRVGIASILQETNTFSIRSCDFDHFRMAIGDEIAGVVEGTNSELAGATRVLHRSGEEIVPIVYAWAMPSGRVTGAALEELRRLLTRGIESAGPLDAMVLSLHGSMASEMVDDADGELLAAARSVVGNEVPVAVCLDLHGNVTRRMVELADTISAYHTDPHVDMAEAGGRAAERALAMATGRSRMVTGFAKRPMIIPAETMSTETGILREVREWAVASAPHGLVELCIFPVQPWLDVAELGLSVVVTMTASQSVASDFAICVADEIWRRRAEFVVERLADPVRAIDLARSSSSRPFLIAESADAPTAGAGGDSPVMVEAFSKTGRDLSAVVPVVDPPAVGACHAAGIGTEVRLTVGASIDDRWWEPVDVEGVVTTLGDGSYRLQGASFTGMEVSMGRFATVKTGSMQLLLTERAAWTSDPATFRHAGIEPGEVDVIVVRSCNDFRPNFASSAADAVTLDVPGTATPTLINLDFVAQTRPPFPLDPWKEIG